MKTQGNREPNSESNNGRSTGQSRSPRLTGFARRLLSAWQELKLPPDGCVVLGVSGGADSTALLLGLDELIKAGKLDSTLIVAHLDHGLRKTSKEDALWVLNLAASLGHVGVKRRTDVQKKVDRNGDNLEQAARVARYKFLKATAKKAGSALVLTAHTLDDQAETILLRLLRGSAAEGLSGIGSVRSIDVGSDIRLARPLLCWARRSDAEQYCLSRHIEFRVDEMNQDETFARVKVRKQLLPLMQSFNVRIVEALARTGALLREDATALTADANDLLKLATSAAASQSSSPSVDVSVLTGAPAAVRRRALRQWLLRERGHLRRLEMVHLLAIDRLLVGNRGGRTAELPDGARVLRKRGRLELEVGRGDRPAGKKS
ncbi:MAG: tRNA lysidine(34) synthetase TilS [Acidobacteriota bacterium]